MRSPSFRDVDMGELVDVYFKTLHDLPCSVVSHVLTLSMYYYYFLPFVANEFFIIAEGE